MRFRLASNGLSSPLMSHVFLAWYMVINGARPDFGGCFGGYKQSGNGREWGEAGLEEFLELKAVFRYASSGT